MQGQPGSRVERPQRYIGVILLVWLLTLMLASAIVLVVLGERLVQVIDASAPGGGGLLGAGSRQFAAAIVALAVALLAIAAIAVATVIRTLRLALYLRRMRIYAEQYLRQHAPLHELGIDPAIVPFDASGSPMATGRPGALTRQVGRGTPTLLLGDSGAGKTATLYSMAAILSRRRSAATLPFARLRLPVLISGAAFDPFHGDGPASIVALIRGQLRQFGSAGLAARTEKMLRRGRIVVLIDDLDAGPSETRPDVCGRLAAFIERYQRTSVVLSCRLESYSDGIYTERSLRKFERTVLSSLAHDQIRVGLRSLPARGKVTRPRQRETLDTLHRLALDATATSPAGFQAIRELLGRGQLAAGRGYLLARYTDLLLADAGAKGEDSGQIVAFLSGLAAGMRLQGKRFLPLWTDETGLEEPLRLVASAREVAASAGHAHAHLEDPGLANRALGRALEAGIVSTTPDGQYAAFANGVVEAAFAAQWLHLSDDGFGALRADFLRPEWLFPLALWATSTAHPGDLAKRILRLTDMPDTVAIRVSLPSPDDSVPLILAVALAVLAEGTVAFLGSETSGRQSLDGTESVESEHLRDVLDLVHIYLVQPDGAERLAAQLRAVAGRVGPEFPAGLARLAADTRLGRLVRSQVITVLGAMGDESAVESLADLLEDMDPLIRHEVNQAFVRAGPVGLEQLRQVALTQRGRASERAGEIMSLFGDDAIATAIELLSDPDESRRISATTTLAALRAIQAESALILKLADPSVAVRLGASRALAALGSVGAREALRKLLTGGDARLRASAATSLGTMQAADAVQALIALLSDTSADVRASAARALGMIGDDAAASALEARQSDDDIWVRQAVESALRRLGHGPARIGGGGLSD